MRNLVIILVTLIFPFSLFAHNNKDSEKAKSKVVILTVTDEAGESIAGAKIKLQGFDKDFFTDFEGKIQLSLSTGNNPQIHINSVGFKPLQLNAASLSTFSSVTLNKLN